MAVYLDLLPPFIPRGEGEEFVKAGHNLLLSVSPRDNSIGVFAGTVRSSHHASSLSTNGLVFKSGSSDVGRMNGVAPTQDKVRDILFASADKMPSAERRLVCSARLLPHSELISKEQFITDTSVIFAAFQKLISVANEKGPEV